MIAGNLDNNTPVYTRKFTFWTWLAARDAKAWL